MIRVLEVLATLKRAGAEMMATSLVCGLDRKIFDPLVVSLYDPFPNDLQPKLTACGVRVMHLGKRKGFDPQMYPRLRTVVRGFRPDVIHTHSFVMRYTLPVAACGMVHTVHNLADKEVDIVGRWIHRVGFRKGVIPVAVSSEVARSFQKMYRFEPKLIANGIETSRFAVRKHAQSDSVTVISVARLDPQKNPGMLVDALPEGCRLLLVGDGSLRSQLEGLDRVEVLGVRTDVAAILSGADIFALASDWEGHPIALMEAMAAGLPVVATAVGGVPEIMGDAGMLVPARDTAAMATALSRLASDCDLRASFGAKARERAQQFDIRRMIEQYSALFEEVARS